MEGVVGWTVAPWDGSREGVDVGAREGVEVGEKLGVFVGESATIHRGRVSRRKIKIKIRTQLLITSKSN